MRENVISSVKALNSWIDVKSELNEKIIEINDKETRNKNIIVDFVDNKMTIEELVNEYNLTQSSIYSILRNNGLNNKISTINKNNSDLKFEVKIIEAYKNGVNTYIDMERITGISRYHLERLSCKLNINLNTNKKTNVKNINWDEKSKRYLIRLTNNKKQIVIGGTKDLTEALSIRDKARKMIDNSDKEGLEALISSLKSDLNLDNPLDELEKYNKLKPKNIRVDKRPKQIPRFEVYVKNKYIGSSKMLDEAIKIRDEYLKSF